MMTPGNELSGANCREVPSQLWCGLVGTFFKPGHAPAHDIGGQSGEQDLQTDACKRSAHEMLNVEGSLHIFVARLDGLAFVIMFKPSRQRGKGSVLLAEMNQHGVLKATSNFEPFNGCGQRIGTAMQPVIAPAQHL